MFGTGNNNGFTMPVSPMGWGGYGGNGNNGFFGGDGIWALLILALLFGGNGWGGGFGGFGGAGILGMDSALLAPYFTSVQTQNDVNRGFDNAALSSAVGNVQNAVTSGFGDTALGIAGVNQSICQTGAGITAAVTNGFAQAEIADNARQMANMQQGFNAQTAVTGAINGVSSQLADCCCEQRLATQALNSTIISENCADREALNNGVRDIIANQTAGIQTILDKMCQQEIDAERRENQNLRTQLAMRDLAASQTAQTAQLEASNARQTQQIEDYVRPQINPAYIVPNPYAYNFPWNNGNWNGGCCNQGCGNF